MSGTSPVLAVLALSAVIGLILLARRAVPLLPLALRAAAGLRPETASGGLGLEQSLSLDPRRRLLLVRCGARRLLILTGGPADVVVGWLDPAPGQDAP